MEIIPLREMIQQEETRSQAAVSESTMSRIGAAINFINTRHVYQHSWHFNGQYNIAGTPNFLIDGFFTYPFPFEIFDVQMFIGTANGTSGTTEVDIRWRPDVGGVVNSIFTVTPKVDPNASPYDGIRVGQSKLGWVAPVLLKTEFDAYDLLRLDLIQAQAGVPNGLFVKVWTRPRNPS